MCWLKTREVQVLKKAFSSAITQLDIIFIFGGFVKLRILLSHIGKNTLLLPLGC